MDYRAAVENLIDGAAKPQKSLGLLEHYLQKLLLAWGSLQPEVKPCHIIYAADNGIVEEGVAAYPAEITYWQAKNMVAGKATISCFCQSNGIPYIVVDVGINNPSSVGVNYKVALGTKNFLREAAMTAAEFNKAWQAGCEMVSQAVKGGANLLSFGEMGIGNTTTSSAVLHALTGIEPEFVVGSGAGIASSEFLKHKRMIVGKGVELHRPAFQSVQDIMRTVGGFDIVAICASMLECSKLNTPFVIDGFITAVAYACAAKIEPQVKHFAIPSHLSKEPGMAYALLQGNITVDDVPIRAGMALGEGTGAVLMVSILRTVAYAAFNTARLADFSLSGSASSQITAI